MMISRRTRTTTCCALLVLLLTAFVLPASASAHTFGRSAAKRAAQAALKALDARDSAIVDTQLLNCVRASTHTFACPYQTETVTAGDARVCNGRIGVSNAHRSRVRALIGRRRCRGIGRCSASRFALDPRELVFTCSAGRLSKILGDNGAIFAFGLSAPKTAPSGAPLQIVANMPPSELPTPAFDPATPNIILFGGGTLPANDPFTFNLRFNELPATPQFQTIFVFSVNPDRPVLGNFDSAAYR